MSAWASIPWISVPWIVFFGGIAYMVWQGKKAKREYLRRERQKGAK